MRRDTRWPGASRRRGARAPRANGWCTSRRPLKYASERISVASSRSSATGRRPLAGREAQSANSASDRGGLVRAARRGEPADAHGFRQPGAERLGGQRVERGRHEALGRRRGPHQVEVDARPARSARSRSATRSSSVVLPAPGGPVSRKAARPPRPLRQPLVEAGGPEVGRPVRDHARVEEGESDAALARDLDRALVARVGVAHDARAGIGGEHALQARARPRRCRRRPPPCRRGSSSPCPRRRRDGPRPRWRRPPRSAARSGSASRRRRPSRPSSPRSRGSATPPSRRRGGRARSRSAPSPRRCARAR